MLTHYNQGISSLDIATKFESYVLENSTRKRPAPDNFVFQIFWKLVVGGFGVHKAPVPILYLFDERLFCLTYKHRRVWLRRHSRHFDSRLWWCMEDCAVMLSPYLNNFWEISVHFVIVKIVVKLISHVIMRQENSTLVRKWFLYTSGKIWEWIAKNTHSDCHAHRAHHILRGGVSLHVELQSPARYERQARRRRKA